MNARTFLAHNLAAAFCSGVWTVEAMLRRGAKVLGRRERWLRPLVGRLREAFPEPPPLYAHDAVVAWIRNDTRFASQPLSRPAVRQWAWLIPVMSPSPWPVPQLPTVARLADWLGIAPSELEWFADCQGRNARQPPGPLRHYNYQVIPKRGGRIRLIEVPKLRLRALQRRVLAGILNAVPPHDAAHGFCRGRSAVSFAAPHVGRRLVLRLDLADFFPSIPASRVHAMFRTAGYPRPIARLLTGLCTSIVPHDVMPESADFHFRRLVTERHLPQGAPTSPALANLCAYRLDVRLAALAASAGATYTRYADDLAFSGDGDFSRGPIPFFREVCRIVTEEGFAVRATKTRIMRRAVCQHLAGVVVNVHTNVRRADFDRLKAILTNCIRHDPTSQNHASHADFRAHLLGRIAHIASLNAARGRKLHELFARIHWGVTGSDENPSG